VRGRKGEQQQAEARRPREKFQWHDDLPGRV
jgi:hypothetical protein